jgi:hypothetical protein
LLWGGYYATVPQDETEKAAAGISLFRLLDFNPDAYHAAFYGETFDQMPTLDDVVALTPCIGHLPIDAKALVTEYSVVQLLGGKPLTLDDLDGYLYYLEDHGVSEAERSELAQTVLHFSQQEPPYKVRLELIDGDVQMVERATG